MAHTERPNYLLIWIGVLILVFTVALRGLVPASLTTTSAEAGGAALPEVEVIEPVLPAVLDPELLLVQPAVLHDESTLVEAGQDEPGFMRVGREELTTPGTTTGTWAAVARTPSSANDSVPVQASRLERVEPASFDRGIPPRPSRTEPVRTDRPSRTADSSVGSRAVLVSFQGPAAPAGVLSKDPEPVEQALILEIAPDTFRAILVVEPVAAKGVALPAEESAAEEAPAEEDPPANEDRGASKLAFLEELRHWLESHDGRADLGPESLQRLRLLLEREGLFQDSGLRDRRGVRRLLVLDLDRAELDLLLTRLAERVTSRAESN